MCKRDLPIHGVSVYHIIQTKFNITLKVDSVMSLIDFGFQIT